MFVLVEAFRPTARVHVVGAATYRGGNAFFPWAAFVRLLMLQFAFAALPVARASVLTAAVLLGDFELLWRLCVFNILAESKRKRAYTQASRASALDRVWPIMLQLTWVRPSLMHIIHFEMGARSVGLGRLHWGVVGDFDYGRLQTEFIHVLGRVYAFRLTELLDLDVSQLLDGRI